MVTKKSGLIFIIVLLALAPLGQADFQIGTRYIDGTPFEPDTDILGLDENLYLSMYAEEFFPSGSAVVHWQLLCDPSLATITGGVLGPEAYDGIIYAHPGGRGRQGWFDYDPWLGPGYEPGVYADNFLYTPQSLGDVTVEFWSSRGGLSGEMELVDSIVITQVPEPMTITLLALGALLLHRRRICLK